MQSNAKKQIVTEESIKKTNKNGMGNKVGKITNRITTMEEIKSRFSPESREYVELERRISCGQLYQQDELDKIKGIIATPMPTYWYNYSACIGMEDEDFLKSICVDKKPYFMIYVYDDYKKRFKTYVDNCNKKSVRVTGLTIAEIKIKMNNSEELTEDESEMIKWFNEKMPFGRSKCSMNSICFYVEDQLDNYKSELKKSVDFDYSFLKYENVYIHKKTKNDLLEICNEYVGKIKNYKEKKSKNEEASTSDGKDEAVKNRQELKDDYYDKVMKACSNEKERLNIVLDLCYGEKNNKQFCWDVVGDLICNRLEELNENNK